MIDGVKMASTKVLAASRTPSAAHSRVGYVLGYISKKFWMLFHKRNFFKNILLFLNKS